MTDDGILITPKQMEAVLRLDGPKRYRIFVKAVADTEEVWGLYLDGWALAATDDGQTVFPMWPARQYASVNAVNSWSGYTPRSFSLTDLLEVLLPDFEKNKVRPGIFFIPDGKGVIPTVEELRDDILEELDNY